MCSIAARRVFHDDARAIPRNRSSLTRRRQHSGRREPLLDPTASKRYFGVDLQANNIVPIFVIVRNNDPVHSYTITTESIGLFPHSHTLEDSAPSGKLATSAASADIGVAGLVLGSPLLVAVAVQRLSDASIIKQNFEAKRFRTTTLDSGKSTAGFVYFEASALANSPRDLCVSARDPVSGNTLVRCHPLLRGSSP